MSHLSPETLEALARQPGSGTTEAQAHLGACPSCRSAVRDAAARQVLLGGLTRYTLSDMAFRRVEARLMEAVEDGAGASSFPWRWLAPVAVALVVVALGVRFRPGVEGSLTRRPPQVARVGLERAQVEPLTVLGASSDARVRAAEAAWRSLSPGQVVSPGELLEGHLVRLAPAAEVAWTFEVSGTLGVGDGASARLADGSLTARVARTKADVAVAGLHVLASEALFSLTRTAAEVLVEVAEGTVELVDSSLERREVKAPQRLRLADGAPLSAAVVEPPRGVGLSLAPPKPWVRFDASSLPPGTRITLDGALLGEAPLSALVASGRHRLGVASPGEALRESWVELMGPFTVKVPSPSPPLEPSVPDAVAVERIQAELQRQRPKLAACYEKWLKANPTASGEVELQLIVSPKGRVTQAKVTGELSDDGPAECLVRTAKGLSLPALGVEVELQVPLKLTTQR